MSNPHKTAFILTKYSDIMEQPIHHTSGFYSYPAEDIVRQNWERDGWKIIAQINIYIDEFGQIRNHEFGYIK